MEWLGCMVMVPTTLSGRSLGAWDMHLIIGLWPSKLLGSSLELLSKCREISCA